MGIPPEIIAGTATRDDPHSWDEVVNIKAPEQHAPGVSTHWSPKDKGSQTFEGVEAEGDDLVHADGMAASHAIDFLKRNKDKPFFLACGLFVRMSRWLHRQNISISMTVMRWKHRWCLKMTLRMFRKLFVITNEIAHHTG